MKKGECIECGKPLFDQNPNEDRQLCDACVDDVEGDVPKPKASDLFY